jgi:hypothetical protein
MGRDVVTDGDLYIDNEGALCLIIKHTNNVFVIDGDDDHRTKSEVYGYYTEHDGVEGRQYICNLGELYNEIYKGDC